MSEFEVIITFGFAGVLYLLFAIGNTLHKQTNTTNEALNNISDTLAELKKHLVEEDAGSRSRNINDIYEKVSELPEEIAKDILSGLSYGSGELGLKYDLKNIQKGIDGIDTRIMHLLRQRKLSQ